MRGRTLKEYIADQMKDKDFKKAWDDLDPEFQVLKAMIKAREKSGFSQAEFARRCGTKQRNHKRQQSNRPLHNMQNELQVCKKSAYTTRGHVPAS